MALKATPSDYYDHLPDVGHAPGDIWLNLPTYGVMKQPIVAGIVVTPACDLQNEKSETVTYLPLLEVEEWLATSAWLNEIVGATQNVWNSIGQKLGTDAPRVPAAPSLEALVLLESQLPSTGAPGLDKKTLELVRRVASGLEAIRAIIDPKCTRGNPQALETLLGQREWQLKRERLVSNALRSDLHFLPALGAASDMHGGLRRHNVAMFRYPMSAPVGVLDVANDIALHDWAVAIAQFSALPAASSFASARPIRIARLTHRFCADLLTRYCMLYNRLGSPDFTTATITRLALEIA